MTACTIHTAPSLPVQYIVWDMSDCYTWSFPEFVPFCSKLYYFSSFKEFNTVAPA